MTGESVLSFERFTSYLADGFSLEAEAFRHDARLDTDLGLDSFDMLEVVVRVEELGVHLPDHVVAEVATVSDLYRVYASRASGVPAGGS